jgi:hypothetical protein
MIKKRLISYELWKQSVDRWQAKVDGLKQGLSKKPFDPKNTRHDIIMCGYCRDVTTFSLKCPDQCLVDHKICGKGTSVYDAWKEASDAMWGTRKTKWAKKALKHAMVILNWVKQAEHEAKQS